MAKRWRCNSTKNATLILGGGVSGLAAGVASGMPVYEADSRPGGLCASYYVDPVDPGTRRGAPEESGKYYCFERGGGHWIFGGDPAVLAFLSSFTPMRRYSRKSAIYFAKDGRFVPFPLQNHLSFLGRTTARAAIQEMVETPRRESPILRDWLHDRFGPTLCNLFFDGFHERYTAGLWTAISPQDDYKSPFRMNEVLSGAFGRGLPAGYNTTFVYPKHGLDSLVRALSSGLDILCEKEVISIDCTGKVIYFSDGTSLPYLRLISTLSLSKMVKLCGLDAGEADPHTSVLVINLGAVRGARCPPYHWIYVPDSGSGFFRVGFYSNVDPSFLPDPVRCKKRVSLYIEFAYLPQCRPDANQIESLVDHTIAELEDWGFIGQVEVVDPTWVDDAYTWSWPGSLWRSQATSALEARGIYQVGRYGRWHFQGIADSIRDGLMVGAAIRGCR